MLQSRHPAQQTVRLFIRFDLDGAPYDVAPAVNLQRQSEEPALPRYQYVGSTGGSTPGSATAARMQQLASTVKEEVERQFNEISAAARCARRRPSGHMPRSAAAAPCTWRHP